jgi:hypothetical protein
MWVVALGCAGPDAEQDPGNTKADQTAGPTLSGTWSLDNQATRVGLVLYADGTFTCDRGPSLPDAAGNRSFSRSTGTYKMAADPASPQTGKLTLQVGGGEPFEDAFAARLIPASQGIEGSRPAQLVLTSDSSKLFSNITSKIFVRPRSWCTVDEDCKAQLKASFFSPTVVPPACAGDPAACVACRVMVNGCALAAPAQ